MDMEEQNLESAIEGVLFALGEPITTERLAAILNISETTLIEAADRLAGKYTYERRGIRLIHLDNALQLCSSPEFADYIRLATEARPQSKLSRPALEVLAIVAYFQPVTRTYIEQVRGVDSSNTVATRQERGLIEECGTLAVPGRPKLFRTTAAFLRTFGISSVDELPELLENDGESEEELNIKATIRTLMDSNNRES